MSQLLLLSEEQYRAARDIIPAVNDEWWLRSPSPYCTQYGKIVKDGQVESLDVNYFAGVRPALDVGDTEAAGMTIGTKIRLAGHTWTAISQNHILCDDIVGWSCFRDNWMATDANKFEQSDVKRWLQKWSELFM